MVFIIERSQDVIAKNLASLRDGIVENGVKLEATELGERMACMREFNHPVQDSALCDPGVQCKHIYHDNKA